MIPGPARTPSHHIPEMVAGRTLRVYNRFVDVASRSNAAHKGRPISTPGIVRCHECKKRTNDSSFSRGRSQRDPDYHCVRASAGIAKKLSCRARDEES